MDYAWLVIQSLDWSSIVLGLIVAGLTAAGVWVRKRRKRIAAWWVARRERTEAMRNLPARVLDISRNVQSLADSNGRTTLQFAVIHDTLKEQTSTLEGQNKMLADISAMAHGQMELDSVPRFICDESGKNRYVNTAYARLVGCGRDELYGFGYRRFVTPSDNPGFIQAFAQSSASHVTFDSEVKFTRINGTKFIARVRVVPHPEDVPPATHWNGMVTYIREAPDEWRT